MRFLVKCTSKGSMSNVSTSIIRQMYEETVDWMNQQKKKGTLIDSWAVPGESTIAICEHSSVEDLAQTISSMPLQGFLNFEIYPLCDINVFMKSQIEYMKHAEKALAGKEMAGVR